MFYRSTKSGVDKVNGMKCAYSTARITQRWTLVLFFSFLNIAGINGYFIYIASTNTTLTRKYYMINLAKELLDGHLRLKVQQESLPKTTKLRLDEILGVPKYRHETCTSTSRGWCYLCDRKNRPTRFQCKVNTYAFNVSCHACNGRYFGYQDPHSEE